MTATCTFCDGKANATIHVVDGAESRRYDLPVCDGHWRDYISQLD